MLFKLDDATTKFVSSIVVDLLKEVIEQIDGASMPVAECPPDPKSRPSAFQLSATCTPNLRGKVTWHVPHHCWQVQVKKPKPVEDVRRSFEVNPNQSAADYREQKGAMYWEAIEEYAEMIKNKNVFMNSI